MQSGARPSQWKNMGFGLGLRTTHYPDALALQNKRDVEWFEIISENYLGLGGRPPGAGLQKVLRIRENFPLLMHGVSLSIGSTDPLNFEYLKQLKKLAQIVQPEWISDHLCWVGVGATQLHDLMPLPFTTECLQHVAERIQRAQDFLGRAIVIENVSSYIEYAVSEMNEAEFLATVATMTGCGLLLDVNNIYVSSQNHGFDARAYLQALPSPAIAQIHLAGHSIDTLPLPSSRQVLIDTHDQPVCQEVWDLYRQALRIHGPRSTMIERDDNIPEFPILVAELNHARRISGERTVAHVEL